MKNPNDTSIRNGLRAGRKSRGIRWTTASLVLLLTCLKSPMAAVPLVALDNYHNNENPAHYTWTLTGQGGFSKLGGIVKSLKADTLGIYGPLDSASLAPAQVLIVVDPDTITEAPNPKTFGTSEIAAIDAWVQRGGSLILLANNAGNCEFTHLNLLASRFGIQFNGDTYNGGYDLTGLPLNNFFKGVDTVFLKDISTLALTTPAVSVFSQNGKVLMATSTKGLGKVFAVGDPWFYNEYINSRKNFLATTNLMEWALTPNLTSIQSRPFHQPTWKGPAYNLSGAQIGPAHLRHLQAILSAGIYHTPSP